MNPNTFKWTDRACIQTCSQHRYSMNPNTFKWTDRACIQTSSNRGCRTVSPLKQPLLIGWQTSVGLPVVCYPPRGCVVVAPYFSQSQAQASCSFGQNLQQRSPSW